MNPQSNRRHTWAAWLFVGTLFGVSLILGVVQYRWIGQVSRAETERLRATVQTSLNRLSQYFNDEIVSAAAAIIPDRSATAFADRRTEYGRRYLTWRQRVRHKDLFRSVYLAIPQREGVTLQRLDLSTGDFANADWPAGWTRLRDRLSAAAAGDHSSGPRPFSNDFASVFEVPRFDVNAPGRHPREAEWLLLELNMEYLRSVMLPELMTRYLGASGTVEYETEITSLVDGKDKIYDTDPDDARMRADASARMFAPRVDLILQRAGLWGARPDQDTDEEALGNPGRWRIAVRHRGGSLEAVVEKSRRRNVAATTSLLLVLLIAAGAFIRYTRRAQQLADLQMQFVAGVSHELRTPLTVMRTAGHNLRGRVSNDPARVQQYGALIEDESGKLTAIVEKVLRFANAREGRVINERDVLDIRAVIEEALEADRAILSEAKLPVEKEIPPDLPAVLGDSTTLRHAIGNLINNAARYGRGGDCIRISAAAKDGSVEVVVEDHGPGIPDSEIRHIFDPFYRGSRALEDQIHGTGLGLSLAKRIVEAHEGSISVASQPGRGTLFTVRLPATTEKEHEFTNSADRG
jgi:signal transduction histidine kinase